MIDCIYCLDSETARHDRRTGTAKDPCITSELDGMAELKPGLLALVLTFPNRSVSCMYVSPCAIANQQLAARTCSLARRPEHGADVYSRHESS